MEPEEPVHRLARCRLTEKGIAEARAAGRKLKAQGIKFDVAFTSALKRAQRTLDLMLEEMGQTKIPVFKDQALNERDYGDLSGLNKDDARKKWGEEQVHIWRRSYDVAPPGGESLQGHRRARAALLRPGNPAARAARRARAGVRARQFAARAGDGARPAYAGEHRQRELATGVPMIYRLNADSTVARRSWIWRRTSSTPPPCPASQPSIARLRVRPQ